MVIKIMGVLTTLARCPTGILTRISKMMKRYLIPRLILYITIFAVKQVIKVIHIEVVIFLFVIIYFQIF